MRMSRLESPLLCFAVAFATATTTSCATEYNKLTVEKLRSLVGDDFASHRWFSYPTDNFGVGTAFASKASFDNSVSLCDSAYCLGVTPASFADWLSVGGFAGVGKAGPTITLTSEEETKLNAELNGPKIAQLVDLGASVDFSRGVTTKISLGKAYPRRLRLQPTMERINSLPSTDLIKKAFDGGTLVLIVSDLVMEALTVSLCVDQKVNPSLKAKLDSSIGQLVGANASMAVKVENSESGCYTLQAQQPVVVATLAAEQPAAGTLSAPTEANEWSGWKLRQLADLPDLK